tara:strand:- start:292 stop:474 length:183 start_codon:yes stop_codon:yes gene_type:complete
MEIGKKVMDTKKEKWDGKSRPTNKAYEEGYDRIFGKKKFNRLQQEQRDQDAAYQKTKKKL